MFKVDRSYQMFVAPSEGKLFPCDKMSSTAPPVIVKAWAPVCRQQEALAE